MTVSYVNDEIRRAEIVHLANGLLRHRFGYQPKSRNLRGPSFPRQGGDAETAARRRLGQTRARGAAADDFRLDAAQPGKIVDLKKAA